MNGRAAKRGMGKPGWGMPGAGVMKRVPAWPSLLYQCERPMPPVLWRRELAQELKTQYGLRRVRWQRQGAQVQVGLEAERSDDLAVALAVLVERWAGESLLELRLARCEKAGGWRLLLTDRMAELQQALADCVPQRLQRYPRMQLGLILSMCKDGRLRQAEQLWAQLLGGQISRALARLPGWEIKLARLLFATYADAPLTAQRLARLRALVVEIPASEKGMRAVVCNLLCHCGVECGELDMALHYGRQAEEGFRQAGSQFGRVYMGYQLAIAYLRLGQVERAEQQAQIGLQLAQGVRSTTEELTAIGRALVMVCGYLRGQGMPVEVLETLHQVETLDAWSDLLWTVYAAVMDAAVLMPALGNAEALLLRWRVAARERGLRRLAVLLEIKQIELALRAGRLSHARQLAQRYGLDGWAGPAAVRRDLSWTLPVLRARWLRQQLAVASGRQVDRAELSVLLEQCQRRQYAELQLRVLWCAAWGDFRQGRQRTAMRTLSQALGLALPQGLQRGVLDQPGGCVELLTAWLASSEGAGAGVHLRRSVQAMLRQARREAPEADARAVSLVISRAQLRVLEELLDGRTNPEIARRLRCSVDTVKFHLKQLARKLGSGNRHEMIARARELGLIT